MPDGVPFKSESDQSRAEIAAYLHRVAEKLEHGDAIPLPSGTESVTMGGLISPDVRGESPT